MDRIECSEKGGAERSGRVKKRRIAGRLFLMLGLGAGLVLALTTKASALSLADMVSGDSSTLEIVQTLTLLSLLPSIVIMSSCFTRLVIVLSFLRNALGLQQTPPNQVLVGIALFLSLFIMSPVLSEINDTAYIPYQAEQISQEEFLTKASAPLKQFMLKQTKTGDVALFADLAKTSPDTKAEDLPMLVVIPSFMTSELRRAFLIGFLIFIPFLIIDLIVSSTLMSMGMIMLPPAMISLPFKLLLFVLVDGWQLLFTTLVQGFRL